MMVYVVVQVFEGVDLQVGRILGEWCLYLSMSHPAPLFTSVGVTHWNKMIRPVPTGHESHVTASERDVKSDRNDRTK